ncbi:unnamed protein product, partial [marine sediment metagenome]
NAYILQAYPKTINSDAIILQTYTKTITSDAYILKTDITGTINSDAYILQTYQGSIASDAEIVYVGNVILISPTDTLIVEIDYGENVVFVWRMPDTYQSTGKIDCKIEIATDISMANIVERKYTRSDSGFEYDNTGSGNWVTYPSDGVTSTYFFNNARYTTTLDPGLYYWRVRGCVR